MSNNPQVTTETGATRSCLFREGRGGFPERLDLVMTNAVALRRLAATYGEGNAKYGEINWQQGFKESVLVTHALEHLLKYIAGESDEDDIAHAVWNLMTLMWVEEKKPELMDVRQAFATLQKTDA